MILLTGLGFVAQYVFALPSGVVIGLLAGFVVANLVPAKAGGCSVRYADEEPTDAPDP